MNSTGWKSVIAMVRLDMHIYEKSAGTVRNIQITSKTNLALPPCLGGQNAVMVGKCLAKVAYTENSNQAATTFPLVLSNLTFPFRGFRLLSRA